MLGRSKNVSKSSYFQKCLNISLMSNVLRKVLFSTTMYQTVLRHKLSIQEDFL